MYKYMGYRSLDFSLHIWMMYWICRGVCIEYLVSEAFICMNYDTYKVCLKLRLAVRMTTDNK